MPGSPLLVSLDVTSNPVFSIHEYIFNFGLGRSAALGVGKLSMTLSLGLEGGVSVVVVST